MKNRLIYLFVLLLAATAFAVNSSAWAGIVSVDTTQGRIPISATGPSTVTVTWQVVRLGGSAPGNPGTISSPSGVLLVNGQVVGTVSRTLSRFAPGVPPATNETLVFTETFSLPQATAFRAIKLGVPIVYRRTFTDTAGAFGGNPASLDGTTLLTPTGPGSVPLTVNRLELSFDDDSKIKVVPKNTRLRAVAEITTSGVGLLQAEWQIATGATTAGTPVFRTLALVRQPVAPGRRTVITSPPLPTRFDGNSLVRLRLTNPESSFDEPELQYYITPESPLPDQREPQLMLVTSPNPGTPLTLTTRFAWQAVPGTRIYKLEIFEATAGPADILATQEGEAQTPLDRAPDTEAVHELRPTTGVVLPESITEIRLQDYTLAHLPSDRRYLWTVRAIDPEGAVIARSPPREIYKP